jgi:hypothetical protein
MRPRPVRLFPSACFSFLTLVIPGALAVPAQAQHGGHTMPDGTVMSDEDMAGMDMSDMDHDDILKEPLGSGTAWLPQGSPVHDHAFHFSAGEWMLMTHGDITARYTSQNINNPDRVPPRGGARFDAPNWAMLSAERTVFENDRLMLRAMMSLDPLTVGNEGYPLLFQTGEGLTDRQHPHDLFMELALLYAHPVSENNQVFGYFGLPRVRIPRLPWPIIFRTRRISHSASPPSGGFTVAPNSRVRVFAVVNRTPVDGTSMREPSIPTVFG